MAGSFLQAAGWFRWGEGYLPSQVQNKVGKEGDDGICVMVFAVSVVKL
jgi:hypothetical protein